LVRRNKLTLCANRVLTHCSKHCRYSITSSAMLSGAAARRGRHYRRLAES
jgi:hypothetical protein